MADKKMKDEPVDTYGGETGNKTAATGTKRKANTERRVQVPSRARDENSEEDEMEFDKSAYVMYHKFQTTYPCLSCDPYMDKLGEKRETFPLSCTLVAGTQAQNTRDNCVLVLRLENLNKTEEDDEESSSSSEDEDEAKAASKPYLRCAKIPHHGGVNRIRNAHGANICATWNDQGKIHMWNLAGALNAIETLDEKTSTVSLKEKPLYTFSGHQGEGFAMDWSSLALGKFASGDTRKRIHIWRMLEGGTWAVDQNALSAHKASVEDLQWSPTEDDMLASCSSDKSIRLWDTRCATTAASVCVVEKAHDSDVNVISWNATDPLLVSGGDDNMLKVWDLKFISKGHPVAQFKYHSAPITSVHWYAHDSTVFAAASEDDKVTIWDLAVEPDDEQEMITDEPSEKVPPQLLFVHQGQKEVKEIRWHYQLPGVLASTALDGFNIFRTVSA